MDTQCELCGTEFDLEKERGKEPACPECFNIAVRYRGLVKWIAKVANFTVRRALWLAGEQTYLHQKLNKHERNNHYIGYMS